MSISVGVVAETAEGERRVAMVPDVAKRLIDLGVSVVVEEGATDGASLERSSFPDGVRFADRATVLGCDLVVHVQPLSEDAVAGLKRGAVTVGFMQPHNREAVSKALAEAGVTSFSMEWVPRISRAQSMDALSSQAAAAGYRAALIAAQKLGKFLPMLTTAAGTIRPAKVLVIGAGVAGLQAVATAKRLGAVVEAYDVRSAAREQVESLGGRFVDTGVSAEGEGGYARELTDEEKRQQQDVLAEHIAAADAVITTAAIPGRPSPRIIDRAMVEAMSPGAVIVDMAAEGGGNCELTVAGEDVDHGGVIIVGPLNLPSTLARHTSEMYARNVFNFIKPMIAEDGSLSIDWDDEVLDKSAVTRDGSVVDRSAS